MSQTYTPGTILSTGFGETLEQVVVLSDGKVATKTYAGKPVARRDIMSLDDWKILVGSFTEDYLPVATSAAAPEVYPIGTFLRWRHPDGADRWGSPNSRTAIVIKNGGILQVKEVINDKTTMTETPGTQWQTVAKKFFPSFAEWKASLPEGGAITTKAGEDYTTPSIKRKAAKPIEAADDISYIKEIQKRYSVHANLTQDLSPIEKREHQLSVMTDMASQVNQLLASPILKKPREANSQDVGRALENLRQICRSMKNHAAQLSVLQHYINFKPAEAHLGPFHFKNDYKQRLVAFFKGAEVEICSSKGFIALALDKPTNCASKWVKPTLGKSFAELDIDMKEDGKPRLKIYYRKDSIEL
jgi:hypothetical protein